MTAKIYAFWKYRSKTQQYAAAGRRLAARRRNAAQELEQKLKEKDPGDRK
jgi:hypothetical protein